MKKYNTLREKITNFERKYLGYLLATEITPKGLALTIVGGAIALNAYGCTSMSTNQARLANNFDFKNQTQSDSPYKMERVILHGKEFYVRAREVNNETELPFEFLPFDDVSRIVDLNARNPRKRITLESESSYIPKKAESPGTTNNYVDILNLSKYDSKERKIKGIKSNIKQTNIEGLADSDFGGSSVKRTEQDASYGIRNATIFGEEYFFPHVEKDGDKDSDKLNFYLVPVKDAKIKIRNSDGRISIENDDKVYRAQEKKIIEKKIAKERAEQLKQEKIDREKQIEIEKKRAKQQNPKGVQNIKSR